MCRLCDLKNSSKDGPKYFSDGDATCYTCPNGVIPAIVILLVCVGSTLVSYAMYMLLIKDPPKSLMAASRVFKTFLSVVNDIGPSKMKCNCREARTRPGLQTMCSQSTDLASVHPVRGHTAAVTFYQIMMSLPASFDLDPVHVSFGVAMDMFSFFELDWSELAYPSGCLVGGYSDRLIIVSLVPFAAIIAVPIALLPILVIFYFVYGGKSCDPFMAMESVGVAMQNAVNVADSPGGIRRLSFNRGLSFSSPGSSPGSSPVPLRRPSCEKKEKVNVISPVETKLSQGGWQSLAKRWQARFVAILPLVVFVVFLMLPSVSRTIFFTWVCVPYQEAPNSYVYYMRRDASVIVSPLGIKPLFALLNQLTGACNSCVWTQCHDDDHSSMVALAVVLVLLWPVGMQLLLFFTLYVNREKLRQGIIPPTTKFLTGGYKKEFFYCVLAYSNPSRPAACGLGAMPFASRRSESEGSHQRAGLCSDRPRPDAALRTHLFTQGRRLSSSAE